MSDKSKIEWTDATWNPVRASRFIPLPGAPEESDIGEARMGWHCQKVSPGCANCYAEPMNRRLGTGLDYKPGRRSEIDIVVADRALAQPFAWRRPRMIFVGSMTDLFADFVTDAMLDRIFAVMALTPRHTYQLLTKRPERMRNYVTGILGPRATTWWNATVPHPTGLSPLYDLIDVGCLGRPLPNVWIGTSVEDQRRADERIPILLDTPAAVRWLSSEPLLGPVDLRRIDLRRSEIKGAYGLIDSLCRRHDGAYVGSPALLDWVVAGGESGPGARPMHPDWARSLRDQCAAAGVPFLFKQWGAWASVSEVEGTGPHHKFDDGATVRRVGKAAAGRLLDGVAHDAYPGLAG
ncbi:phage Gp37/Gp68 family protein [Methylopila sp. M107]|uniref:phage Gp37/Gp68 family protein n=1 Tax=Methylopila sp. M107 TaxID=1101190 RepID=UPI00036C1553|nr:phage Gp37/Gp68 family protein [Methylopila sp. M107]